MPMTKPDSSRIPANIPSVPELVRIGIDVNNPGKSQAEIAREIGFTPNQVSMLTMIKQGRSRLAFNRVAKASKALKTDPVLLLAAVLKERTEDDPESWEFIRSVFFSTHSQEEDKLLTVLRDVEKAHKGKYVLTPEREARLRDFLASQLMY